MNCDLIKFEAEEAGRFKIMLGGEYYGMVSENAFGRFVARGSKPGAVYGASAREAAVALIVRDSWAEIKGPVLEASRKAMADADVMVRGMVEKGILPASMFPELFLKEAA